jgi:hypothetical protein
MPLVHYTHLVLLELLKDPCSCWLKVGPLAMYNEENKKWKRS